MAAFNAISSNDTADKRKEIGLPVTKPLRYMKSIGYEKYEEHVVTDYEVIEIYQPSGTHSLLVTIDDGSQVRILAPYFVQMQKPTFEKDMHYQKIWYAEN